MGIVGYENSLLEHWFEGIGSLYYGSDFVDSKERFLGT